MSEMTLMLVLSGERGQCPRLACGHWGPPHHVASSQWDFPHEALHCDTCGTDRQMHVLLQALLDAEAEIPGEWEDAR